MSAKELPDLISIKKNALDLLKSWSQELESTSNRIRFLIGDQHWLSDGKHKEAILSNFLRKYTFDNFVFSTGFIVAHDQTSPSSGEIDILVSSKGDGIPWFYDSDILITPPENVIAHVHVKSSYNKDALLDIFKSVKKANIALSNDYSTSKHANTWSAGFFFNQNNLPSIETMKDHIIQGIKSVEDPTLLPKGIYISPHNVILMESEKNIVSVRIIKADDLAAALFLTDFFESTNTSTSDIGDLLFAQLALEVESFSITLN